MPHIGNIRTALFDYLLARRHGGQFILRLEDTDRTPSARLHREDLRRACAGSGSITTRAGYRRAVRAVRAVGAHRSYRAAADRLLAQGDAYECWCSSERLDAVRAEQSRLKQPPKYDRRCRESEGQAASRREAQAEGRSCVVRFKTPLAGAVTLHDAVFSDSTFDLATIDDFVMLKSDGFPTYHLKCIVDDEMMKITHVLRGNEWISSAPPPADLQGARLRAAVLAHLPLVLGPDGAKLSKRHGATSDVEYRDAGYLPDAVFNFLGLLGWSLDDKTEIISRERFIEHFTLEAHRQEPGGVQRRS